MIKNQRVFWSGQYLFPDSDDPGDEPDVGLLEGTVTFVPVWDASTSGLLSDSQRSTYVKQFPFEIRDGQLMSNDDGQWVPGVRIPASIGGHPLAWVARFDLIAGGTSVQVRDLRFPSNPDGEVHLHNVIPAEAIYPQLPQDIVKGDSVTDIYTQGQYVVFIVGDPPRTKQYVLAFPGTAEAAAAIDEARDIIMGYRDDAQAARSGAESAQGKAETARSGAETARGAAETAQGKAETAQSRAEDAQGGAQAARSGAETARGAAETAQGGAETARDDAQTARSGAETARDDAQTARSGAETARGAAETAQSGAQTARSGAEAARGAAETAQGKAEDAQSGAEAARGAAETAQSGAETARDTTLSSLAGFDTLYDQRMGAINSAADGWDAQFDQDLATFQNLKTEMQNIASSVAIDLSYIDEAIVHVDDALDIVRAHRWVPRGEWDAGTTYIAGDVVVFDDGSFYAGADIPVGVAPPGDQWVVFGQGGISDASELTGKLGPLVDASDASVDLSGEVGVPSDLHDTLLHELLGALVREMDATIDAPRIQGALTDQVNVSGAMVTFPMEDPVTYEVSHMTLPTGEGVGAAYNLAYQVYFVVGSGLPDVPIDKATVQPSFEGSDRQTLADALGGLFEVVLPYILSVGTGAQLRAELNTKADLDGSGKLSAAQLPALAITEFLGTPASQAAMLALTGQRGDWCVRTDRGTQWILIADNPAAIGSWREMVTPAAPVSSVAGRTGAIVLSKSDVGLSNADNTSDANKPISTAVSQALGTKAASDHTHATEFARVAAAPATWHWAGTSLPTAASQVHAQARVGDFIVAPNLTTDPGWHRITGV